MLRLFPGEGRLCLPQGSRSLQPGLHQASALQLPAASDSSQLLPETLTAMIIKSPWAGCSSLSLSRSLALFTHSFFTHSFILFWGRPHLLSSHCEQAFLGDSAFFFSVYRASGVGLTLASLRTSGLRPGSSTCCVGGVCLSVAPLPLIERIPGSARSHLLPA